MGFYKSDVQCSAVLQNVDVLVFVIVSCCLLLDISPCQH